MTKEKMRKIIRKVKHAKINPTSKLRAIALSTTTLAILSVPSIMTTPTATADLDKSTLTASIDGVFVNPYKVTTQITTSTSLTTTKATTTHTTVSTTKETTTTTEATTINDEVETYEEENYDNTYEESGSYDYDEGYDTSYDESYEYSGDTYARATYYEGGYGTYGASGRTLISGYSVASSDYAQGTLLYISGGGLDGTYRVDDCGCASGTVDFFYNYGETPSDFQYDGVYSITVTVVG